MFQDIRKERGIFERRPAARPGPVSRAPPIANACRLVFRIRAESACLSKSRCQHNMRSFAPRLFGSTMTTSTGPPSKGSRFGVNYTASSHRFHRGEDDFCRRILEIPQCSEEILVAAAAGYDRPAGHTVGHGGKQRAGSLHLHVVLRPLMASPSEGTMRRSWFGVALLNLAVLLGTVVLFCGAAEAILRVKFARSLDFSMEMWKYAATLKHPVADPHLSFAHIPNSSAFLMGAPVSINSQD